jgi:phosphohistidine phosphatase SixA
MRVILVVISSFFLFSCSQTFYVVRHAEKAVPAANMSSDVQLSNVGKERAERLTGLLHNKKIRLIYSTNTIRTRTTAEPTANYFLLSINTYGPKPDSAFINLLKSQKKNTLVVGHSNTVDDIVNMLCGETKVAGDLDETIYDNLYVIKRRGKKFVFRNDKF